MGNPQVEEEIRRRAREEEEAPDLSSSSASDAIVVVSDSDDPPLAALPVYPTALKQYTADVFTGLGTGVPTDWSYGDCPICYTENKEAERQSFGNTRKLRAHVEDQHLGSPSSADEPVITTTTTTRNRAIEGYTLAVLREINVDITDKRMAGFKFGGCPVCYANDMEFAYVYTLTQLRYHVRVKHDIGLPRGRPRGRPPIRLRCVVPLCGRMAELQPKGGNERSPHHRPLANLYLEVSDSTATTTVVTCAGSRAAPTSPTTPGPSARTIARSAAAVGHATRRAHCPPRKSLARTKDIP